MNRLLVTQPLTWPPQYWAMLRANLAAQFSHMAVQEIELEHKTWIEHRVEWPESYHPVSLFLNCRPDTWRFLFQAKGGLKASVAAGQVHACHSPLSELHKTLSPGLEVVGGVKFPSTTRPKSDDHKFYLPELLWNLHKQSTSLRIYRKKRLESPEELLSLFEEYYSPDSHPPLPPVDLCDLTSSPNYEKWVQGVQAAQREMAKGALDKVVLARMMTAHFSGPYDIARLLFPLYDQEEPSYFAAMTDDQGQTFISRSPERLIKWTPQQVEIDAIAGTRPRSPNEDTDLRWAQELEDSTKEQGEHLAVTDYIKPILEETCQIFGQTSMSLLKLKHVQHLVTRYQGSLKDSFTPCDLIEKLHPTPAVAGTPKSRALELIQKFEGEERGFFAGLMGIVGKDFGDLAIGIRSALHKGESLTIFAGAGIVPKSDPKAEWEEITSKMKNFTDLIGLEKIW